MNIRLLVRAALGAARSAENQPPGGVALQCFCKLGLGMTRVFTFYAVRASGATSARSPFSFSRSPGVMRMPRQRLATSTVTA